MDPALLNEMLTSLRIIRDEIAKLRETDATHRASIDGMSKTIEGLEKALEVLASRASAQDGSKKTRDRIAAAAASLIAIAIAAHEALK